MATLVGLQTSPVSLIRNIIELDYDAIEAYEAAIEKLEDPSFRAQMEGFCADHRRHVADLNPILERLGGIRVVQGDIKRVLTKGKVLIASLIGDRAVLLAMKTNEKDTNIAYERAVAHEGLDASTIAALYRNLGDERRHRAWIIETLIAHYGERRSQLIL
jgi:rubrerythrin